MLNIQALFLSIAPVIISALTQFVKETAIFDNLPDSLRDVLLKLVTAALALASSLVAYATSGTLDGNVLESFIVALALFLATFIPFWFGKLKKKKV